MQSLTQYNNVINQGLLQKRANVFTKIEDIDVLTEEYNIILLVTVIRIQILNSQADQYCPTTYLARIVYNIEVESTTAEDL